MPSDIDTAIQLQDLRQRVLNREPITAAEYRDLINALHRNREGRAAAQAAERRKTAKTASEPKAPVDLKALFGSP